MVHTILYFGHFDRNFRNLASDTTTYLDRDGVEKPVDEAASKVDGCRFRYMQIRGREEFVAVGVDDLVLRAPVLLIPGRHTDGKGFFAPPQFGDESAMRLLVDLIIANPESRDTLARSFGDWECDIADGTPNSGEGLDAFTCSTDGALQATRRERRTPERECCADIKKREPRAAVGICRRSRRAPRLSHDGN